MNIKLLLQHGTSIYDATPILEGCVEWFASVMGKAGRLKFRVVRDGIVNFVEGDRVSFYVDSVLLQRICDDEGENLGADYFGDGV